MDLRTTIVRPSFIVALARPWRAFALAAVGCALLAPGSAWSASGAPGFNAPAREARSCSEHFRSWETVVLTNPSAISGAPLATSMFASPLRSFRRALRALSDDARSLPLEARTRPDVRVGRSGSFAAGDSRPLYDQHAARLAQRFAESVDRELAGLAIEERVRFLSALLKPTLGAQPFLATIAGHLRSALPRAAFDYLSRTDQLTSFLLATERHALLRLAQIDVASAWDVVAGRLVDFQDDEGALYARQLLEDRRETLTTILGMTRARARLRATIDRLSPAYVLFLVRFFPTAESTQRRAIALQNLRNARYALLQLLGNGATPEDYL